MSAEQTPVEQGRPDGARRGTALIAAVVFALLYAWFLYQAVGNLINVPPAYAAVGLGDRVPWALLVAGVVLPVLFFVGAALLGRRRALTERVLVYAAGLAASSATALSLYVASAYLVAGS